jgi:hypothetical protein
MGSLGNGQLTLTDSDIDALAWAFLTSQGADEAYAGRPLDQRLEVFLRHRGLLRLADDGDVYKIFLDRVLAYIGVARQQPLRGG